MIKLKNLSMSYALDDAKVEVLREIDLTINEGESVAVVGPSGSGKTTLLLLLAGLDRPESGEVFIDGHALADLSADELADLRRDRLGIVFQSFHLVPSLSALGNVALPLEIAGHAGAREKSLKMLDQVGLLARQAHYPSQLSGGEQQRVAISRALVHSPTLLLADEPTGNLDKQTGKNVGDMLFNLRAQLGATLILATHDEHMARRCSRLLHLDEGKLWERHADDIF
ncbi:MAG: putative ABC transport system ATP-binding protein [Gammaproteobacteria bacterium]|jgi:putative ABC transport system ATP-binding protein